MNGKALQTIVLPSETAAIYRIWKGVDCGIKPSLSAERHWEMGKV